MDFDCSFCGVTDKSVGCGEEQRQTRYRADLLLKPTCDLVWSRVLLFACPCSAPDLLKKKKPRSLLPVSTSMDHRPKEDMLQDCITLASVTHGKGEKSLLK